MTTMAIIGSFNMYLRYIMRDISAIKLKTRTVTGTRQTKSRGTGAGSGGQEGHLTPGNLSGGQAWYSTSRCFGKKYFLVALHRSVDSQQNH